MWKHFVVIMAIMGFGLKFITGAEFHVSPNGSDRNSGLSGSPWKTIGKANQSLKAGDTVFLHAGTYAEVLRPVNNGVSDTQRITYRVFGDGLVKLTYFPGGGGDYDEGALQLGLKDYVTVSGRVLNGDKEQRLLVLSLSGYANSYGNCAGSTGVIVENIKMEPVAPNGAPSRGFAFAVNYWQQNYETKYCVLRNCHIIGKAFSSNDPSKYTEDIVTIAKNAHHILIENNIIESCNHSAIYADSPQTYGLVIRNNRIINLDHSALSIWSAGVALADGARVLVENNWLESTAETVNPVGDAGNALNFLNRVNVNNVNSGWRWGVGKIQLMAEEEVPLPQIDSNGVYGYSVVAHSGYSVALEKIIFDIGLVSADQTLDFSLFDGDSSDEIQVLLNDELLVFDAKTSNNSWKSFSLTIAKEKFSMSGNTLTFQNKVNVNDPNKRYRWGVKNIGLESKEGLDSNAPGLVVDLNDGKTISGRFAGALGADSWVGVYPVGSFEGHAGGGHGYLSSANAAPLLNYATGVNGAFVKAGIFSLDISSLSKGSYELRLVDGGYWVRKVLLFTK